MDPELYNAAMSGDVDFLQRRRDDAALLIFQKTPKDSSILHIAAEFNRLDFFKEVVSLLCPENKSLLKHVNSTGDSPLHIAAAEGSTKVVEFIIGHTRRKLCSSDIEQGAAAAVEGDEYKEVLGMVNEDGDNALHLATQYGRYEVAKLLVEADPELAKYDNKAGQSACFMAMVRYNRAMVELLLDLVNPLCSLGGDANGMSVLHAAVFYSSSDIIKRIVSARPETIRMRDAIGWTPLHYAARSGAIKTVEIFLKCDPSAAYLAGNEGESPLHIAAFNGHINVMEVLVNCRPDCWHVVDKKRQTALHAAVLGEEVDVVEYILGFPGLRSMARLADQDGNTPLHLAGICRNTYMIAIISRNSCYGGSLLFPATNKQNLTAIGIFNKEVEDIDKLRSENVKYETVFLQDRHEDAIGQLSKLGRKDEHRLRRQLTITTSGSDRQLEEKLETKESRSAARELLQLTATLIATVTFTAGFTMPGGYKQSEDKYEGMAVLASEAAFRAFLIFDIISFFSAITVVFLLLAGITDVDTLKKMPGHSAKRMGCTSITCLFIAFLAMALAFTCGVYAVLVKSSNFGLATLLLSITLTFICFWGTSGIRAQPPLHCYIFWRKVLHAIRYLPKFLRQAVHYLYGKLK